MNLRSSGALPSRAAHPDQFTGSVWMDGLAEAPPPSRLHVALVTFEPGARTAWHTHPLGQVLVAVSGIGLAQAAGEAATELHPGDTLVIAPGERHWHGAAPDRIFTHLSMQQADEHDAQADWSDHVSDDDYLCAAEPTVHESRDT